MCIRDSYKGIYETGIEAAGVCRCRQKADRMGGVDGTGAVSYTHLDVYKRQEREKESLTEIAQAHEFEIISLGGGRPHMAVSYTHLDVYKRQLIWSCQSTEQRPSGLKLSRNR